MRNILALRITWGNVDEILLLLQGTQGRYHLTPFIGPGRSMELGPGLYISGWGRLGIPGDWVVWVDDTFKGIRPDVALHERNDSYMRMYV